MKLIHICIIGYNDNYTYQENLLSKYHKEFYDVEIIASVQGFNQIGDIEYRSRRSYTNEYGIPVTRLEFKNPQKIYRKLKGCVGFYDTLEKSKPDILFVHGVQMLDIKKIVKYLKNNKSVKVFVDSHVDFSNSATNWVSKNILHKFLWRRMARQIEPFTTKFYGVLPARVDFLKDIYRLPPEKCELLVMGGDDELVEAAKNPAVMKETRRRYRIAENEFLIVTGGKIDRKKAETINLMKAIRQIPNRQVKLIVFGSVVTELREEFNSLLEVNRIIHAGWLNAIETYSLFAASDLVVFPGLHSVLWEQAVACGKPCVFRKLDGFKHIDIGGNCAYFDSLSVENMRDKIENLIQSDKLMNMTRTAMDKGTQVFSYRKIAKQSIFMNGR